MAKPLAQIPSDQSSVPTPALRALLAAGRAALAEPGARSLEAFATAAAEACGADAAVVRLADPDGETMTARAVHAGSPALAARLTGTRARRGDAVWPLEFAYGAPFEVDDGTAGAIEVLRDGVPFSEAERLLADLAAAELALVLAARSASRRRDATESDRALVLAAEAFAAGADDDAAAEHAARLAVEASGAEAAFVWRAEDGEPVLAASFGDSPAADSAALSAARVVLDARDFLVRERIGGVAVLSFRLGEPPAGVLQLVFADDPDERTLAALQTFALRTAQALTEAERSRVAELQLERTRALLDVASQAGAQLSLQHVAATAVRHATQLVGGDRGAVYLRDHERLHSAFARNLAGPHLLVGQRLLELVRGPYRNAPLVVVPDIEREPALAGVGDAVAEAGIESIVCLPLIAGGDLVGLLAVYNERGFDFSGYDETLLTALASQLAIAVQNARLHESAEALAADLNRLLASEREAARRVRALYEVSQSFAQSLSLEATLDALARSAVELLGVDAAAIRMADVRGELLTTRALHVGDARLDPAVRSVLARAQPLDVPGIRRLMRLRRPLELTADVARELGGAPRLLAPFLEKGSTAAVVPIATPAEVVATLTIVSFDPGRPIGRQTLETALSIAAQAALAIDNGRLYQQQKAFADTMQRSLLPLSHPQLEGIEIGEVYESSARVDVGGDVYDFVELPDGRLAVVLGDVTGHGIEAAADMAMARFVFRSLSREHPEPGDFLASANEVVVGEVAPGKFVTMVYLTVEPASGAVIAASAGHPPPLLVSADGEVGQLRARGLALGVESGQTYVEERARIEAGDCVVVYTDGVPEARREGELYGVERLSAVAAANRRLAPAEIARAVIDDCRAYAGELADDCAVVVIKKTQ